MAYSVKFDRYLVPATGAASTYIASFSAALAIALAYLLAAQLGLSLLAKPSDVAVFWPASGLAAGILIAGGRRAGMAAVLGVILGTVAANLLSDRSLATSILKGFCNAGEAILMAWLLERWFGRPFTFGDFRRVVGFFAAAALATATFAVGGAVIMTELHTPAPFWDVWRTWFLSDAVGIVVVAPLLIELSQLRGGLRVPGEVMEAAGALAVLGLVSTYVAVAPTGSWLTFSPVCIVLPLLVWLAARVHRIFAIAGALLVSLPVICATTLGIGHFGDGSVPTMERVQGAQATVIMVTVFALVLSALFAERRRTEAELKRSEAELKGSNNRLQLALDCAELGTWSLHLNTGGFENDVRDRRIHGHGQEGQPKTLAEMRSQVHPDDLSRLDAAFAELEHAGGSCKAEYRLAPHTVRQHPGRIRWVTMEGTVLHRPDGRPEQLLGVTRDITERKLAEEAVRTSEERLRRVSDNADVGLIRCSRDWFYLSANPAYAKIVSKPLDQITGRPMAEVMGAEAVETIRPYVERVLRGEHVNYEAEVPFAGAGKRYLHVSYTPDTDVAGQIVGWVACVTDISERKHAENALRLREVELGEAQRLAHIGSWYWDVETDVIVASDELLRIFGLVPATDRVPTLSEQRGRWYPDADWKRVKAALQRTMRTGVRSELDLQAFRNGTPIWVTARGEVVRNSSGLIIGLRGTVQDITDRKWSELTLAERNTQLELAGRAARVGSYVYDVKEGTMQVSQGYAAIHGLPEGTAVTTISAWRARVHPEDLARAEGLREHAFVRRRKEDNAEYRIVLSTGEDRWIERRGSISYDADGCPERVVGVNIDISERKKAEAALRESEARLAGQREALELALNGAPLETSLGVLVRAATDQLGEGVRAAFYLANSAGNTLHHIVGMPVAYAEAVDGFVIGPESLACGLATHTGLPVLTPDVAKEPRWTSWLWLAETFDFRGCWSFPIQTVGGRFVGTLAIYWRRPREATSRELELAAVLTATAAIIIARHTDAQLRNRAQDALRESEARLNAVIEGAADGILTIDETGIVRSLNTAAVKMFGYAAEEVIGRNVSMLALEPYRGAHDGHLKSYRETAEAQIIGARREVEGRRKDRQTFPMDLAVTEVPSSGQRLFVGIVRDISGRKRAEERQRTLVAELDHRVKNALATVSSVVSHTRQGSRSVPDFAAALEGRLRSMAATHELLSARWWQGVSLTELVRRELAPYAAQDNTQLSGPEVMLRAEAGQAIAMVLHELVTNAAKYGALSTKKGCVSIRWDRRLNGRAPRLVLEWQELGGPPVIAPGDPSYGTSTIRDLIPYEFGGTVDLVFAPEGVQCRLELPADWFIDAGDLGSGAIASAATK